MNARVYAIAVLALVLVCAGCATSSSGHKTQAKPAIPETGTRPDSVDTVNRQIAGKTSSSTSTPYGRANADSARQNEIPWTSTTAKESVVQNEPLRWAPDAMDKADTGLLKSNTVRLVTPPKSATDFDPLRGLWGLYRAFEFRQVLELVPRTVASGALTGYEVASAYTLAAASAYLLGNGDLAQQFISKAFGAEPLVMPDPGYFPSEFCRLYAAVMQSRQHGR